MPIITLFCLHLSWTSRMATACIHQRRRIGLLMLALLLSFGQRMTGSVYP